MDKSTYRIAEILLETVKDKFEDDFTDIPSIKIFWHNVIYLFFTTLNYFRLMRDNHVDYSKMIALKLMPHYLNQFFERNRANLEPRMDIAVEEYFSEMCRINDCRQDLLNLELDFSGDQLSFFSDKVSRDNTGSYYTPKELSDEIIKKVFESRNIEKNRQYRIADFSCGGGDFFISIMEYLRDTYNLPCKETVKWFYGVDIDPITLQNCIVNLLMYADSCDWKSIVDHFNFGNPLMICESKVDDERKNCLFATQQLYAEELGLSTEFFNSTYDMIVGNPPWEKVRFEERKFFRGIANEIVSIPQKNIRDAAVKKLELSWPKVYEWRNVIFKEYAQMTGAKYVHCKIRDAIAGELNTYSMFTELGYNMLSDEGILALIVKSTLVTAPIHRKLWNKLLDDYAVKGVYLFDNKKRIFKIDSRERFIVLVASKTINQTIEFSAGLTEPQMINTSEPVTLSIDILSKINPFTNTIPNVSNNEEIDFLKCTHSRMRLFADVYPECHFGRLIHLTAHAAMIDRIPSDNNVPIYEGKFLEQYDARYASFKGMTAQKKYANKASAMKSVEDANGNKDIPESRYFVRRDFWEKYLYNYSRKYSLCWRSLTSPTNRRTMLAMILPTCPTCQSIQMLQTESDTDLVMMLALFNSIPFDYCVRIKMPGLDLTQSVIKQIPVPSKEDYEEIVDFNGKTDSLKNHILSYTISIIKNENRLNDLVENFKDVVYDVRSSSTIEKQKMIDVLFQKAYHLSDDVFQGILTTFPKYSVDRTA